MLSNHIDDKELLYRAVPNKPQLWKKDKNRPSSAIFKDSKGVSVDRDGNRDEISIINTFLGKFDNLKAIVKISAENCRKHNAYPKYDPIPDNHFHSLILDSATQIPIKSSSKAKKLQKAANIVFESTEK